MGSATSRWCAASASRTCIPPLPSDTAVPDSRSICTLRGKAGAESRMGRSSTTGDPYLAIPATAAESDRPACVLARRASRGTSVNGPAARPTRPLTVAVTWPQTTSRSDGQWLVATWPSSSSEKCLTCTPMLSPRLSNSEGAGRGDCPRLHSNSPKWQPPRTVAATVPEGTGPGRSMPSGSSWRTRTQATPSSACPQKCVRYPHARAPRNPIRRLLACSPPRPVRVADSHSGMSRWEYRVQAAANPSRSTCVPK